MGARTFTSRLGCAAALACLVLGACHGDKQQIAAAVKAAKDAAAAKRPATADEQTVSMVEAATLGKATAPVQIKFELPERPLAGQTVAVELAVIPGVAAQSITVHFGDSPGLVFADRTDWALGAAQPGSLYRQEIKVTAAADGVYFLGMTATIAHDAFAETRVFSIPIIVGGR